MFRFQADIPDDQRRNWPPRPQSLGPLRDESLPWVLAFAAWQTFVHLPV
jgi:hypothetical protein